MHPLTPMTRREALRAAAVVAGGMLLTSSGVLAACARGAEEARQATTAGVLAPDDLALAEAMADTLLPDTAASPGARAAGAGAAMQLLLTDCYRAEEQQRVVAGLAAFRASCAERCGSAGFAALPRTEREALLRAADSEAEAATRAGGAPHWYPAFRELAQRAYLTSEVGMTRALRYERVPGRWVGCVPLAPGQPAWG